jgi:hypothetical protein
VRVFSGEEHELFCRLHLPNVNLNKILLFYSDKTKGNNSSSLFAMDPATKELGRGAVTLIIPIPMEWVSLFVNNLLYGTAIRQMLYLFDLLTKDEQVNHMPILEMMAKVCCGADNSGKAKSTLSSKWAQLRFHAGEKTLVRGGVGSTYLPACQGACPVASDPSGPVPRE